MKNTEIKEKNSKEITGEELLKEYLAQDKDNRHNMGYNVTHYMQTHSDGNCCSSCCCC